jgi:hypothetical protein
MQPTLVVMLKEVVVSDGEGSGGNELNSELDMLAGHV